MINRITICADGHMIPEYDCLGRTGEHNATVLKFDFFEDLNGKSVSDFEKFVVVLFPEGEKSYPVSDACFKLPQELTVYTEIILRVDMKNGNDVIFRTEPRLFTLEDSDISPSHPEKKHPLIGNIDALNTQDKSNLVNAINEVLRKANQGGNTGGNIDLSNFVTKDMMPEIDVDEVVERTVGTENVYAPNTDKTYWADNTRIDPAKGCYTTALYPTCVTPEIFIAGDCYYKLEGSCYETEVYQYDYDGNFIEVTYLTLDGIFKAVDNACYIRIIAPKFDFEQKELSFDETIEFFNNNFKLYLCDRYKLKNNVQLPDNVKLPDSDYVLTEADKTEIAELSASLIDTSLLSALGSGVLE